MTASLPERRTVWVTGSAAYASSGSRSDFWPGLFQAPPAGQSRRVDAELGLEELIDVKQLRRLRRHSALGVAAARDALHDAGIDGRPPSSTAVVIGNAMGDMGNVVEEHAVHTAGYVNRLSSVFAAQFVPNAPATAIAIAYGLSGHIEGVTAACASGAHAILSAARLIAHGYADIALAGGAESPLFDALNAGLLHAGVLAPDAVMRPFDSQRCGFVLSEGAGMVVLEASEHARARGATPRATVLGGAVRGEGFHLIAQRRDGSGVATCIEAALCDARLSAADIVAISSHGTATVSNDVTEARGITHVFPHPPPVIALKGATAHCAGASGAIEVAAVVECFSTATLPPIQGHVSTDEEIALDLVLTPRPFTPGPTLVNSFGLGGHSTSLVIAPPDHNADR